MRSAAMQRSLPLDSRRPLGRTLEDQFTRTFDVYPFEAAHQPQASGGATNKMGMTTGSVYGFGSAALRFQDDVYGSVLPYGKVNHCIIELEATQPVPVTSLASSAPSQMLPDFAANFAPELGRNFATTVNRDAPPGPDGRERFYVQPKDQDGIFPNGAEPGIFAMHAPRGTGRPGQMHEVPAHVLTPAERREALVFDKCHERARLELRKAANQACALTRNMQDRYPNGVLGVEGPACADSLIYRGEPSAIRTPSLPSQLHELAAPAEADASMKARRLVPVELE